MQLTKNKLQPNSNRGPHLSPLSPHLFLVPVVAAEVPQDSKFTSKLRARNEGQTLSWIEDGKWKKWGYSNYM